MRLTQPAAAEWNPGATPPVPAGDAEDAAWSAYPETSTDLR